MDDRSDGGGNRQTYCRVKVIGDGGGCSMASSADAIAVSDAYFSFLFLGSWVPDLDALVLKLGRKDIYI